MYPWLSLNSFLFLKLSSHVHSSGHIYLSHLFFSFLKIIDPDILNSYVQAFKKSVCQIWTFTRKNKNKKLCLNIRMFATIYYKHYIVASVYNHLQNKAIWYVTLTKAFVNLQSPNSICILCSRTTYTRWIAHSCSWCFNFVFFSFFPFTTWLFCKTGNDVNANHETSHLIIIAPAKVTAGTHSMIGTHSYQGGGGLGVTVVTGSCYSCYVPVLQWFCIVTGSIVDQDM